MLFLMFELEITNMRKIVHFFFLISYFLALEFKIFKLE